MPRTLLHFVELLINRPEQNGFEYLRSIIDKATPLYQERLNNLPPAQRKVVLELGLFWDATKVQQLIEKCKMPGKVISAQLIQLVKAGVVKKIKAKNNLYRLCERFFNLWLLMTQGGPKEKHQVKHLTVFLENWYDKEELQFVLNQHLMNLSLGKLKEDHALLMSTALAHSLYITIKQRDELIEKAQIISDGNEKYETSLPEKSKKIYRKAEAKIFDKKFEEARNILNSIEQNDSVKFLIIAESYLSEGNLHEAEFFFLKAIKKGNVDALNNMGILYTYTNRQNEAKKFYLKAIEKGHIVALFNLACLYTDTNKYEEAEKFYLKAIEKGQVEALNNLAYLYYKQNKNKINTVELIEKYISQKLINKEDVILLLTFIRDLLVHQQNHLVWELFTSEKYGEKLKSLIKPLYYVAADFIKTKESKEEILKPGTSFIKERQKFYYD